MRKELIIVGTILSFYTVILYVVQHKFFRVSVSMVFLVLALYILSIIGEKYDNYKKRK